MALGWRALSTLHGRPGAILAIDELEGSRIRAGFTTRLGGTDGDADLSLRSGKDPTRVAADRARMLSALGERPDAWTIGEQVHGAAVAEVTSSQRGSGSVTHDTAIPGVDALWTSTPGVAVAVLAADCVPILLADADRERVGVIHAGWRGALAGVIGSAVAAFGVGDQTRAAIGPSIGPCCYRVGHEVLAAAVEELGPSVQVEDRLDLWAASRIALRRAGVPSVDLAALCTRCEPERFFSHRAGDAGRQAVLAVIQP